MKDIDIVIDDEHRCIVSDAMDVVPSEENEVTTIYYDTEDNVISKKDFNQRLLQLEHENYFLTTAAKIPHIIEILGVKYLKSFIKKIDDEISNIKNGEIEPFSKDYIDNLNIIKQQLLAEYSSSFEEETTIYYNAEDNVISKRNFNQRLLQLEPANAAKITYVIEIIEAAIDILGVEHLKSFIKEIDDEISNITNGEIEPFSKDYIDNLNIIKQQLLAAYSSSFEEETTKTL